jgi:hypothetical protein
LYSAELGFHLSDFWSFGVRLCFPSVKADYLGPIHLISVVEYRVEPGSFPQSANHNDYNSLADIPLMKQFRQSADGGSQEAEADKAEKAQQAGTEQTPGQAEVH